MANKYSEEQIDSYLANEMNVEEMKAFQEVMEKEVALKEEVTFRQDIINTVKRKE